MEEGVCKRKFPKGHQGETEDSKDGYPRYRRREHAPFNRQVQIRGMLLDNRWVVPYNPWLCQKYDAHLNVEVVASIKPVKYLYK